MIDYISGQKIQDLGKVDSWGIAVQAIRNNESQK